MQLLQTLTRQFEKTVCIKLVTSCFWSPESKAQAHRWTGSHHDAIRKISTSENRCEVLKGIFN